MNKKLLKTQQRFFSTKNTKRNEIEKWIKEINQLNQKSIYDLTWKGFYKELQRLGIRRFLNQYGFSHKRQLQQTVARSGLSQKNLSLYDFEGATEQILFYHMGSGFFDKINPYLSFDPKNHKLSTIHYFLYGNSFYFTALSLGFSSKQNFLNFFAQTLYVSECIGEKEKSLRMCIQSLHAVDPNTLRKELGELYDQPLPKNINYIKYNYTLEELKLALEKEDIALVVASLGGNNTCAINKKLRTLSPLINVSLDTLKFQSWESLKENTPIFIWKIKRYQLFSGQIPSLGQQEMDLFKSRGLATSGLSLYWHFFTPYSSQGIHEKERRSNFPRVKY